MRHGNARLVGHLERLGIGRQDAVADDNGGSLSPACVVFWRPRRPGDALVSCAVVSGCRVGPLSRWPPRAGLWTLPHSPYGPLGMAYRPTARTSSPRIPAMAPAVSIPSCRRTSPPGAPSDRKQTGSSSSVAGPVSGFGASLPVRCPRFAPDGGTATSDPGVPGRVSLHRDALDHLRPDGDPLDTIMSHRPASKSIVRAPPRQPVSTTTRVPYPLVRVASCGATQCSRGKVRCQG